MQGAIVVGSGGRIGNGAAPEAGAANDTGRRNGYRNGLQGTGGRAPSISRGGRSGY
jgi:hypothetical protein